MLEITAKDINKGSAIKHILAETEIDKKDAIAIGDSQNDIPAFFECGDSYSIKSKDKKVLETASHSIPYFKNAIRDIISNIIKNK
jgi:hydroxymethylpyrimidine pyrophosphatase-like HAD family hydrolase